MGFAKVGADGINPGCQRAGNGGLGLVRFVSPSGGVDARANSLAEGTSRAHSTFWWRAIPEVGQVSMPVPVSVKPRL